MYSARIFCSSGRQAASLAPPFFPMDRDAPDAVFGICYGDLNQPAI